MNTFQTPSSPPFSKANRPASGPEYYRREPFGPEPFGLEVMAERLTAEGFIEGGGREGFLLIPGATLRDKQLLHIYTILLHAVPNRNPVDTTILEGCYDFCDLNDFNDFNNFLFSIILSEP